MLEYKFHFTGCSQKMYVTRSDYYVRSGAFEGEYTRKRTDFNGKPAYQRKYFSYYAFLLWDRTGFLVPIRKKM